MKKTRHTTPQIIEKLPQADVALGKGSVARRGRYRGDLHASGRAVSLDQQDRLTHQSLNELCTYLN